MKKTLILMLVTVLLFSFVGCGNEAENNLTALDYVSAFGNAGLPVENIIEYTEETDINGLLGRPDQYISKVNFADNRIEQYDPSDPWGGTVEVFESKKNLESRKTNIESYFDSGLATEQYIYVSADGLALFRLEFDLTPEQAGEYEEVFMNIEEYLNMEPFTDAVETASLTEEKAQEPTEEPTQEPTEEPTQEPTKEPTQEPTEEPTQEPTEEPTQELTEEPTQEPTEEPTQEPTEEPTQEPTEEPGETVSQRNAVQKAKDYLRLMAFSRSGLIEQLEYEGFDTEDATYGVDECGADWMKQAAKKAEDYLDIMSFSWSGLIDQLTFDGFTKEQAEYGVDQVGLQ